MSSQSRETTSAGKRVVPRTVLVNTCCRLFTFFPLASRKTHRTSLRPACCHVALLPSLPSAMHRRAQHVNLHTISARMWRSRQCLREMGGADTHTGTHREMAWACVQCVRPNDPAPPSRPLVWGSASAVGGAPYRRHAPITRRTISFSVSGASASSHTSASRPHEGWAGAGRAGACRNCHFGKFTRSTALSQSRGNQRKTKREILVFARRG
jgi:hypothetical protein